MKHVISLGAGVQSSTMALMAAKGEITPMPDFAVFADTQAEPQSVYTWLDWLEKAIPFPVYRATTGSLEKDALIIRKSKQGKTYLKVQVPMFTLGEKDGTGILWRKCTTDYKIVPIQREVKSRLGYKRAPRTLICIQWMGISTDEAHRMKDSRNAWVENRYPLIEMQMSRSDCLQWMEKNNYPMPPRSSCVFCPFHTDAEWLSLKNDQPKEFQRAVEWESNVQEVVKLDKTLRTRLFVHSSRKPLSEVQFKHQDQPNMFGNECEGMCGV